MGSSAAAAVVLPPRRWSSSWKSNDKIRRRIPTSPSLLSASISPPSASLRLLRFRSLRHLSASSTIAGGVRKVGGKEFEGDDALLPLASSSSSSSSSSASPSVGFIVVGYLGKTHGIDGEIRVSSTTGFPELRFCTPGTRWLRYLELGEEKIRQVELLGGRKGHKGYWLVYFDGFDTVEKAKQLVGSSLLVREDDRPILDDGGFYTPDLIGMKVVLKENGTLVGTVTKTVNHGANDLLQVKLDTSEGVLQMEGAHGSLIWIPFVEAIVPDVDMDERVMRITPPKGLLELNVRSDARAKKERSKMEWKERRKFQKRVSSAKKKLSAMGQKHVLEALSYGENDEKVVLTNQILDIDYGLLQHVLNNINTFEGFDLSAHLESELMLGKSTSVPKKYLTSIPSDDEAKGESQHPIFLTSGVDLIRENKVCMILVVGGANNDKVVGSQNDEASSGEPTQLHQIEDLLNNDRFLMLHGERIPAPVVIISLDNDIECYRQLFLENDYFGFDMDKVRFLKGPRLPVLSSDGRILLKSPWEMLQSPVGSGGIFSLLHANHILDEIRDWGVNYVQVTGLTTNVSVAGQLSLLGFVKSQGSDIGFRIAGSGSPVMERDFDVVLTVKCLNKIANDPDKIRFHADAAECEHAELIDGEWRSICTTESKCICVRSSIYSLLDTCSDRVCILRTTQD